MNDIREIVSNTTYRKGSVQIRHLAQLNKCMTFDNLQTTVAATKCGKWIHWPNDITGVGDKFTDGTQYTIECPLCYKK